ncbi:Gfo/Idh/MocA family oxidoreductase [Parvibaculum sp.]|uniref:Gfo/Idh/MocA family protein n=1 Tax=Parvibaculum sp. TaxID=2024848 RepID=UPI000C89FB91|nr:Gfo/Idh/MocA family oxidoreductase [Parvibaculum sp.]MAB14485.1 oxidoreductase [Parvibaculum sp.]
MTSVCRFLLSGPGLIGGQHARLVAAKPDCELAAIVAPDVEDNRDFATEHGVRFFTNISDAFDEEKIDAAIISSPNAFHYDQVISCISRGIPALVEKPVTDDIGDAARLVEEVERSGVPVLVGHHRHYSPLLDAALGFLHSERFGRLVALQGAALFYKPEHYFEDGPWRMVEGGGPILINLIHEIGLMRAFGGEIATVQAMASDDVRGFEVEDTVSVSLAFQNGALGTFLLSDAAASSKSWEMTSGENPAYPHFPGDNCYHFAGTNGSLDFPSMQAKFYGAEEDRSWWKTFEESRLELRRSNPLERQLDHFIDVIRKGAAPRVSVQDGYLNMLVVEAIRRSIRTRAAVDVAER